MQGSWSSSKQKKIWMREQKQMDAVHKTSGGSNTKQRKSYKCRRCGRAHAPRKCPAYGRTRVCQEKKIPQVGELKGSEDDFEILAIANKARLDGVLLWQNGISARNRPSFCFQRFSSAVFSSFFLFFSLRDTTQVSFYVESFNRETIYLSSRFSVWDTD